MSNPAKPADPRPLHDAFSREQDSQAARNIADGAAARRVHDDHQAKFNTGVGKSGTFIQPGQRRGK